MNVNTYVNDNRLPSGASQKISERINNLESGKLLDDRGTYFERKLPTIKKVLVLILYFTVGGIFFTNVEEKDCADQPALAYQTVSGVDGVDVYVELDGSGEPMLEGGVGPCTQAWTGIDAMYYSVVTVTTVGYGDFAPTTDEGRVFAMFYILIGLGVVFTVLSDAANYILQNVQGTLLEKLDDDPDDNEAPHGAKIAISAASILICVLLGTWFFTWSEGFSFSEAIWWSFVTTTTVGYGDLSLENESSQIFSLFFILISVMVVATAIGNLSAIQEEIKAEKQRNKLLEMELNEDMILGLDKSGEGSLDKEEFVTGMLVMLDLVDEDEIVPWRQRFAELDVDQSGELDSEDLKRIAKEEAEKAAAKKEVLEAKKLTTWQYIMLKVQGKKASAGDSSETSMMPDPEKIVVHVPTAEEIKVQNELLKERSATLESIMSEGEELPKYLPVWLAPYEGILVRVAIIIVYFTMGVVIFTSIEERDCDLQPGMLVFTDVPGLQSGKQYYQVLDGGEFALDGETCTQSWTVVDALYYSVVTVTTVGYGDFAPSTYAGRYFGILYILVGLAVIFKFINEFATYIIETAQEHALNKLDDDPDDDQAPHGAKIAISIIAMVVMVLIGTAFYDANEDFTFLEGFWWSFVTTTTVGYGDLSLTKESSRLFSIFYILFSVMIVAASIGNFAVVASEIQFEKNKTRLLEKSLDENLILNLDADGGGSIDKEEFVVGNLTTENVVGRRRKTLSETGIGGHRKYGLGRGMGKRTEGSPPPPSLSLLAPLYYLSHTMTAICMLA
jgi:voltage-gated potassium channel Kch